MKSLSKDVVMITVGSLCCALALTIISNPNELTEGGVPGTAIILYYALAGHQVLSRLFERLLF